MTTIDEVAQSESTITAGTIPLHPGNRDYAEAKGKVVLWVKDEDEGRSLYMGFEAYGNVPYVYEVRYDDWADIITRMMGDVILHNADDPFAQLLNQGGRE